MDSSTGSAADKKRNKLGYHRTSVACVHCRRRKIRCLLAANDAQGRCENCIRLKKECHFYPVDQQPAVDKRGRTGTKIDTAGTEVALTTTPPTLGGTQLGDQEKPYLYSTIPMNPSQDNPSLTPGHFAGTPIPALPSDPLPVSHVGTGPPLNQTISWNDQPYFDQHGTGITSGTPVNPVTDGIMQQEAPLAIPLSSTSPIVISQNPTPMVPSNISAGQVFSPSPGGVAWGIQVSGPMSVSDPSGAAPAQYVGPLQAPSPIGAPGLRSQMTSPGTVYSDALSPLVPEPQPAGLGASFVTQAPTMGYQTWSLTGAPPETLSHPGQMIVGTTPGSLAIPGWYQHDALYPGMPPDETQIMEGHNQGSFDAGALHRQG